MTSPEPSLNPQEDFHERGGGKQAQGTRRAKRRRAEFRLLVGKVTNALKPVAQHTERCGGRRGWKGMLRPRHEGPRGRAKALGSGHSWVLHSGNGRERKLNSRATPLRAECPSIGPPSTARVGGSEEQLPPLLCPFSSAPPTEKSEEWVALSGAPHAHLCGPFPLVWNSRP